MYFFVIIFNCNLESIVSVQYKCGGRRKLAETEIGFLYIVRLVHWKSKERYNSFFSASIFCVMHKMSSSTFCVIIGLKVFLHA